ncbi:hypothetical protein VYU27_007852 [Nannochloropsis oceanica]
MKRRADRDDVVAAAAAAGCDDDRPALVPVDAAAAKARRIQAAVKSGQLFRAYDRVLPASSRPRSTCSSSSSSSSSSSIILPQWSTFCQVDVAAVALLSLIDKQHPATTSSSTSGGRAVTSKPDQAAENREYAEGGGGGAGATIRRN